jgi:hypothetical protein
MGLHGLLQGNVYDFPGACKHYLYMRRDSSTVSCMDFVWLLYKMACDWLLIVYVCRKNCLLDRSSLIVTLCNMVGKDQRFGRTYWILLQGYNLEYDTV